MKIAYISGSYTVKPWNKYLYPVWLPYKFIRLTLNIYRARKVAQRLWSKGYAVICPHMNSAYFKESAADYLAGDLEFIKRMNPKQDIMIMLPGWESSAGSYKEWDLACKLEILVLWETL